MIDFKSLCLFAFERSVRLNVEQVCLNRAGDFRLSQNRRKERCRKDGHS